MGGMGGFGGFGAQAFANCGELFSLFNYHSSCNCQQWLPEMFEPKDDDAWVKDLYEKEEISEYQHNWLKSLLKKKREEDKDGSADKWWKSNFTKEQFDAESAPDFVKDHVKQRRMADSMDSALVV